MRTEQQLTIQFNPEFNFKVEPFELARKTDPETSKEAAKRAAKELVARHHKQILEVLQQSGPGGKDFIASRCGLSGVQVARRMAELAAMGFVRPSGKKATSTAGRPETEWEIRS
jgi:hypothetical protein